MKTKLSFLIATLISTIFSYAITIDYELRMEHPNAHYFQVKMIVGDINSEQISIKMPVWAPGSYLVREFAKGVDLVTANDENGTELMVKKSRKNTWDITLNGANQIEINYEVYAFELSVRTSFLDDSHGYINGTSVFMFVDGYLNTEGTLKIYPHKTFKKISTPLTKKGKNTFIFKTYDELVDSPIEIGNHKEYTFEAAGVTHTIAMYGKGNYDIERLKVDMAKIIEAETDVFKENPNKDYLFIIHNLTVGSGGLEHKKATTLEVDRWTYDEEHYLGFISLVAHEYFHLWNVKRIRPKALGPFDYDNENYTDLLWVMEGFTSYYDELILRRAGFYTQEDYINRIVGTINYVENQPGNKVQPVAHSSYDAWIKAYRHNENSVNSTISYYSKGQILACMLDLYIIKKFNGEKSLDDFMQKLYADFYKKNDVGFTEEEFNATLADFLKEDVSWFINNYVYDTKTIDYQKFFSGVGVKFTNTTTHPEPFLGVRTSMQNGKLIITTVYRGSAAETYGVSVNDEIISINGFRVNDSRFNYYISNFKIGDEFEVVLARDEIIKTYTVKMGDREPARYKYAMELDSKTRPLYNYWLRVTVK
jgi:predicted metalloprotease with PDZ domain